MESPYIHLLISALVKSATYKPLNKSCVMPIKPFLELFSQWPDNEQLCIKRFRLKTITLMALILMLNRPDIATMSVHFNSETFQQSKWLFFTNNGFFFDSGCAKIVFHGIKNDSSRLGFEVQMQPTNDPKLNPGHALQVYIARTEDIRPLETPVFLSLVPPFGPISASTVAGILNEAINLSDLNDRGFSAKKFQTYRCNNCN